MALKINNTNIDKLYLNGAEYKALCINGNSVFGKKFSLTQRSCIGASVTINRKSSPNQHATLGIISSGDPIYYGDTIEIDADAAANYNDPKLYVYIGNNTYQKTLPYTFTVDGDVTYSCSATEDPWVNLLSAPVGYTSGGSLSITGLSAYSEVQIKATVYFSEECRDETTFSLVSTNTTTEQANYGTVPFSVVSDNQQTNRAYVSFTRSGDEISIHFNGGSEAAKGYVYITSPTSVQITEVRGR